MIITITIIIITCFQCQNWPIPLSTEANNQQ